MTAFDRLAAAVRAKRSPLVLGLDPRPERMPAEYRDGTASVTRFHEHLLDLVADQIVGVKPQIAFFEAMGVEGLACYAETCRAARERGLVVIGDVKRGDIGSTAAAYAKVHYEWADILTLHAWLGDDSVAPFLEHCRERGRGAFVLCATSNPDWARFQASCDADGVALWQRMAEAIHGWSESCRKSDQSYGPVGAVVGATHAELLADARALLPKSWLLLPGVGAQGARMGDVADAFDAEGLGALVPVSRGLASCFDPSATRDVWEAAVSDAATGLVREARAALPGLGVEADSVT